MENDEYEEAAENIRALNEDEGKKLKAMRRTVRSNTTTIITTLQNLIKAEAINGDDIEDQLSILNIKETSLLDLNQKIYEIMDSEMDDLNKESDSVEKYKTDIQLIRTQVSRKLRRAGIKLDEEMTTKEGSSACSTASNQELVSGFLRATQEARLPQLTIQKFNGDVTEWTGFWTQYQSTIGCKTRLAKVDKFAYLKQYLTGEPLKILNGMKPSDSNYDEVVKMLEDREDFVSHAHMKNLWNLEFVQSSNDLVALRKFYDACDFNLRSLRSLGIETSKDGTFLCPRLIQRLPKDIRLEYTKKRGKSAEWDIDGLVLFLKEEIECRETCERFGGKDVDTKNEISQEKYRLKSNYQNHRYENNRYENKRYDNNKPRFPNASAAVFNANVRSRNIYCIFCQADNHHTNNCTNYALEEKKQIVRDSRRCVICMRFGHEANSCTSYYNSCRICKLKHNSAICESNEANKRRNKNQNKEEAKSTESAERVNALTITSGKAVLLQTALAKAKNPQKDAKIEVRCLLDPGSQATFVTEETSRALQLPVIGVCEIQIQNFGNKDAPEAQRNIVRLTLENAKIKGKKTVITAVEVPYICESVTTSDSRIIEAKIKEMNLQLADEATQDKTNIDILIEGDSYWEFATGKIERFNKGLVAIETTLGWSIQGPVEMGRCAVGNYVVNVMKVSVTEKEISRTLQSLWTLEGMGIREIKEDPTENQILDKFKKEVKINEDGRYRVMFPWNSCKEDLQNNLGPATKRAEYLNRKFEKDPEFYEQFKAIIQEQLENGIIEIVENPEIKPPGTYYLPSQGVKRAESETTKLRVVFGGSSHVTGAPSLNECMASGPNLNPDLLKLIIKFRSHRVAVISDIEKAFLQVELAPEDRNAVRFLWTKENENGKIMEKEFTVLRMARVPFGVTASPFLLAATIKTHIENYKENYPDAYEALNEELYVDDLTSGKIDTESAFKLSMDSSKILSDAKMTLRKWQTNDADLRKKWIEETNNSNSKIKFDGKLEPKEQKILGLIWDPNSDLMAIDVEKLLIGYDGEENTKRIILSVVSQIYDPVGFLSPCVIRAKMLLQKIWQSGKNWDETLPEDITLEYKKWRAEIQDLKKIKIPRCYYDVGARYVKEQELHCFTDASKGAYAAVVYIRFVTADQKINTAFVTSKTRIAPIKDLKTPKLELMGCVLGARLVTMVKSVFKEDNLEVKMWSDSTVAIHWIKKPPKTWKPFVQNRVSEIQQLVEPLLWAHCPGKQNPADLPTRGVPAKELMESQLWWHGPTWLNEERSKWPCEDKELSVEEVDKEKRKIALAVMIKKGRGIQNVIDLTRYSTLNKALRILAYVFRFVDHKLNKKKIETGAVTTEEMKLSETRLIIGVQNEDYSREIEALTKNKEIPKDSSIATLKPILNEEGVLCVGGRLEEADFSYQSKHRIIINKNQNLALLIMKRSHEEVIHSGIQATATQAREKFWIIAGRQIARNVVRHCYGCRRFTAKAGEANTGLLPKDRVKMAEPFSVVGTDFAGPLLVKIGNKLEKAYVCLFTCATTRALHLELVPTLSTYEFLMALRRMIARRGIPTVIYSDNAKTFKRAKNDLNLIWSKINDDEIRQFFGRKGIEWKSIVEKAPWAGGFYERIVKSVKTVLRKVIGKASLTYQEMETVLLEAEAVINSRPITYVFNDANEPQPLSPAQFLIGKRVTCLPPQKINTNIPKTQSDFAKRLRYRNNLMNRLWIRWKKEYLLELRTAHHIQPAKRKTTVKVGDIMLVHKEKTPRQMWKLGIVQEVMIGRDGKIRSCLVKTEDTVLRRPIQLLYALEITNDVNDI